MVASTTRLHSHATAALVASGVLASATLAAVFFCPSPKPPSVPARTDRRDWVAAKHQGRDALAAARKAVERELSGLSRVDRRRLLVELLDEEERKRR